MDYQNKEKEIKESKGKEFKKDNQGERNEVKKSYVKPKHI